MKYLLDTNVISEAVKSRPDLNVLSMLEQEQGQLATAAPVWHELQYGCHRMADSHKRRIIERFLRDVVQENIPILPYCNRAAAWHARQRAMLVATGKTPHFVDGQIAAIAKVYNLVLITRNVKDFLSSMASKSKTGTAKMFHDLYGPMSKPGLP